MSEADAFIDPALLLASPHRLSAPSATAKALLPCLDEAGMAQLLASKRLSERLDAMIVSRLEPASLDDLDDPDRNIIAAGPEAWRAIGLAAGSIRHQSRVRRLILGTDIAAFTSRCGAIARRVALADAFPDHVLPSNPPRETLEADVESDGDTAYRAWHASLPAGWRQRLALLDVSLGEKPGAPTADNTLAALYRRAASFVLTDGGRHEQGFR